MHDMKTPEQWHLVLSDMDQPPAKKVKHEHGDQYGSEYAGIQPVHKAKALRAAPVADEYDDQGEECMDDQVYNRETKIHRGMTVLIAFVIRLDERDRSLNDPEDQQPCHQECQAFYRPVFEGGEILDDAIHCWGTLIPALKIKNPAHEWT